MLRDLLGSVNKERALVYLAARERGYPRQIARFFGGALSPMQNALEALEAAGVLISRSAGTSREYQFNPRYAARDELRALIDRALELYPRELREALSIVRTRPRRARKPL